MTSAMEKFLNEMAEGLLKKETLKVGFQNGMKYPSASGNPVYVAQVAFWNEYGTAGSDSGGPIPPRPFFRTMIAEKSPKWGGNIGRLLANNGYDLNNALGIAGGKIVEQLQDSIKNGAWEANAPSTIARKGFDKPLIDKGIMWRDSITYSVEEE